jgi:hypothetical protein
MHEFHTREVTVMSVERPGEERQIQREPTFPAALPILEIQNNKPLSTSPDGEVPGFKQPAVVTKLQVLLRAHQVARGTERRRWLTRAALVLAALGGSVALGAGVNEVTFEHLYDHPDRHAQRYHNWGGTTFYVKGEKVSQQEYDYYLQTNSNQSSARANAAVAGVAAGCAAGVVLGGACWWLTRRKRLGMSADLEEQINSIVRGHPAAVQEWGGPAVLRQPELVAEVLRIEERNARAERQTESPRGV